MAQRDVFIYDDILSSDYDVYVLDVKGNITPSRDFTTEAIPGRNGEMHIDNGRYNNVDIPYTCAIISDADVTFDALSAALLSKIGYKRLEDSVHPEYYRMAIYAGDIKPTMFDRRNKSVFELTFNCKPQKYLKSGEKEITVANSVTVHNPTRFGAKPLIKVTGTGTISFNGDQIITVSANPGNMVIDCDTEDAYNSQTKANYNSNISLSQNNFPVIPSGDSVIAVTGGLSAVVIPRWWTI